METNPALVDVIYSPAVHAEDRLRIELERRETREGQPIRVRRMIETSKIRHYTPNAGVYAVLCTVDYIGHSESKAAESRSLRIGVPFYGCNFRQPKSFQSRLTSLGFFLRSTLSSSASRIESIKEKDSSTMLTPVSSWPTVSPNEPTTFHPMPFTPPKESVPVILIPDTSHEKKNTLMYTPQVDLDLLRRLRTLMTRMNLDDITLNLDTGTYSATRRVYVTDTGSI